MLKLIVPLKYNTSYSCKKDIAKAVFSDLYTIKIDSKLRYFPINNDICNSLQKKVKHVVFHQFIYQSRF